MLTHEYTCACAAVDAQTGELGSLILPDVNTHCMRLSLDWYELREKRFHNRVAIPDGSRHPTESLKIGNKVRPG